MKYRTLTMPSTEMDALLVLARTGAKSEHMTDENRRALARLELTVVGAKLPGHAPGHHRGPDLDLRRKA